MKNRISVVVSEVILKEIATMNKDIETHQKARDDHEKIVSSLVEKRDDLQKFINSAEIDYPAQILEEPF